jgi:hypothetical protein
MNDGMQLIVKVKVFSHFRIQIDMNAIKRG